MRYGLHKVESWLENVQSPTGNTSTGVGSMAREPMPIVFHAKAENGTVYDVGMLQECDRRNRYIKSGEKIHPDSGAGGHILARCHLFVLGSGVYDKNRKMFSAYRMEDVCIILALAIGISWIGRHAGRMLRSPSLVVGVVMWSKSSSLIS